ncbi:MAG: hypothetical protein ACREHG_08705, partial [Candidatus Saccharimonadales bacterium]
VIKAIEDAKALTPDFKSELASILSDAKAIAAPLGPAIAAGGTNVVLDVSALEPVITHVIDLVKDVIKFIPTLEAAVKELSADLEQK